MSSTLEARRSLSNGIESEMAVLRQLHAGQRVAEIAFFAIVWIASGWLGMTAMGWSGVAGWIGRVLAIAAGAAALNAFYLLSHEGHHHLLFRNHIANHLANVVLCVPLLHSPRAYRVLHELHHRFLGGPGDPDEYRNYSENPRVRWGLQWVRLTIGTLVYMPLIPVVAWRRADLATRRRIVLEYAGMSLVWIAIFAMVPLAVLLQLWLIPGVIVGYISAVRAVAQHALTDHADPLLASRSVRSNRIVSFLLLNENYHLEHHLFPEVPSYHLPRLHALLRPRLPRTVEAPSYSRFMAGFIGRSFHGDESPMDLR